MNKLRIDIILAFIGRRKDILKNVWISGIFLTLQDLLNFQQMYKVESLVDRRQKQVRISFKPFSHLLKEMYIFGKKCLFVSEHGFNPA